MANNLFCHECKNAIIFDNDLFGSICSQCGLVLDGADLLVSGTNPTTLGEVSSLAKGNTIRAPTWIQREAKKLSDTADRDRNGHLNLPLQVTAVISAVLNRFGHSSLQRETADLFNQVKVLSKALHDRYQSQKADGLVILTQTKVRQGRNESASNNNEVISEVILMHGDEADSRIAIACTFSILKRYDETITLDAVCRSAGNCRLALIADTLRYIESLFGGTQLLKVSRDDPSIHLISHIALLSDRAVTPSVEAQEAKMIKAAKITTLSFLDLVTNLCNLCARNGLNNRSVKMSSRKDLSICAWAILMITMEASSGSICREGKMAELMSAISNPLQDVGLKTDATSNKNTTSELIKKRYVEITRMLTMYMQYLPWLSDQRTVDREFKTAKKAKGKATIPRIKADLSSIKPFPRKIISNYLVDILKLEFHIEVEMKRKNEHQDERDWSRFGSTEDLFHRIRASADGQRMIKEEEEEDGIISGDCSKQSTPEIGNGQRHKRFFEAAWSIFNKDQSRNGRTSDLAKAIGPRLLQEEKIQSLPNHIIDSLFFLEGEMESYMRTAEEIEILGKIRAESGDWDDNQLDSNKRKRSRSNSQAEEGKIHSKVIQGKRTKALPDKEVDRIMSLI